MVQQFSGSNHFLENIQGKKATFLLAGSVTKTCEIEGITQAGIPGLIHLTPTLDAEFVKSGKLFALQDMAKTPKGVPTPAIITRAVKMLTNFPFETLNLGLHIQPKVFPLYNLGIQESENILQGAGIDAKEIIKKGKDFANFYEKKELLILGESTPSGTTTAHAVGKTLGYKSDGYFSSSFLNHPQSLKERVIKEALEGVEGKDIYERLGSLGDNMLLFTAGFAAAYSQKAKIVLGGGTQMAAVLLIIDALKLDINPANIALMTTKWVYEDEKSDIKGLLSQLAFDVDGYYADFSFKDANIPVLKLYDEGEAKEGVGAGAALCYAQMSGFSDAEILTEIEKVLTS